MKGAELPINIMIVLIIAVIVLIAMVAFFLGAWVPSTSNVNIETLKNTACQRYTSARGCQESRIADAAPSSNATARGITFASITCPDGTPASNLYELARYCYTSQAHIICGC